MLNDNSKLADLRNSLYIEQKRVFVCNDEMTLRQSCVEIMNDVEEIA